MCACGAPWEEPNLRAEHGSRQGARLPIAILKGQDARPSRGEPVGKLKEEKKPLHRVLTDVKNLV